MAKRIMNPNSLKNLRNINSEQAREMGKKGGKKSGEVRKEKKTQKEILKYLVNVPLKDGSVKEIKNIAQVKKNTNLTVNEAMCVSLVNKAIKGNIKAVEYIRELVGEDKEDIEENEFYINPYLIPKSFSDLYRFIKDKKYSEYILKGGRGSGKSSFISIIIIELIKNNKNMHVCIFRRVSNTLRDSVYNQICWAIDSLCLNDEFDYKVSPLEIKYKKTGQTIYFRGLDDETKIKSIKPKFGYIGICWFEEIDQIESDEKIRNVIQSVLRGGDYFYLFKSYNPPKTVNAWINKYIKIPKKSRLVHTSTYLDMPDSWIGKIFIDEANYLKEVNPKSYEHEYIGIPNGTGGEVFDNIEIREITDDEISKFNYIYRGIDWGWYPDPLAYIECYYDSKTRTLYIFREIYENKLTNLELIERLKKIGVTSKDLITADSNEQKSIDDLRINEFFIRAAEKGPFSVNYSVKWLQSLVKIVIDNKRCPNASEEFLNYEYEKNKDGDVINSYIDKNNHTIDSTRYALETVWKRRGK